MQLASFLQLESETNQTQQEGHTEKRVNLTGNSMQRIGWHHHERHYRGDIDDFLDSPTRKPCSRVARIRHFYRFDCSSSRTQKTTLWNKDISHLRFYTLDMRRYIVSVCYHSCFGKAASLRPSAYSNNSLQAPYTSVSSTCGYSSPICSLWETVKISPRTAAAAKDVPRFGARSYFSKS